MSCQFCAENVCAVNELVKLDIFFDQTVVVPRRLAKKTSRIWVRDAKCTRQVRYNNNSSWWHPPSRTTVNGGMTCRCMGGGVPVHVRCSHCLSGVSLGPPVTS